MSEILTLDPSEYPDISQMVLEDDTPLDFINEKQQRLLTTVFYSGADTGIYIPLSLIRRNVDIPYSWLKAVFRKCDRLQHSTQNNQQKR